MLERKGVRIRASRVYCVMRRRKPPSYTSGTTSSNTTPHSKFSYLNYLQGGFSPFAASSPTSLPLGLILLSNHIVLQNLFVYLRAGNIPLSRYAPEVRETKWFLKAAESVNASVASSGSACDLASLGFGFSFFRLFSFSRRVLGSAERSDADLYQDKHTPRCQIFLKDL